MLEFTPWNVFPFIPDIDEMVTRQRREGLFAAVMTFSRKTTVDCELGNVSPCRVRLVCNGSHNLIEVKTGSAIQRSTALKVVLGDH